LIISISFTLLITRIKKPPRIWWQHSWLVFWFPPIDDGLVGGKVVQIFAYYLSIILSSSDMKHFT